jgi:glycosyltransferase involved in cell wall biosynthesis
MLDTTMADMSKQAKKSVIPSISIIIPYVSDSEVLNAIKSIHKDVSLQSHEIILVLDNKKLSFIPDLNIGCDCTKSIRNLGLPGPAGARNRGTEIACGELISFLDSDDTWLNGRYADLSSVALENKNAIVFGKHIRNKIFAFRALRILSLRKIKLNFQRRPYQRHILDLQVGNVVFHRNNFIPFNENMKYGEDRIWVLENALRGNVVIQVNKLTLEYFFSRPRANSRWDYVVELEISSYLDSIQKGLGKKYLSRESLRSFAYIGATRDLIGASTILSTKSGIKFARIPSFWLLYFISIASGLLRRLST